MIFSRANFGTLFTSLAIQCCGLITGILTARILGPTARGELTTVMLWPVILSNLGLMGCNWALAREVARDSTKEADWTCAAILVGFTSAILYLVLGYILIPYVLPTGSAYLSSLARVCLWLIPLDILNQTLLAVEHGRMRWQRYNLVRASFYVFYAALICLLWANRKTEVRWFVYAFLAGNAVALLFRVVIETRTFSSGNLHASDCFRLIQLGMPYFCATASNLLSLQLDKILVVALMSTKAVGIYAVALTFGNAQSSVGEALGITSFGILSNEKNPKRQGKILTETFRQATLTSAGIGLILACFVPLLIRPLFGSEFSQAVFPAVVLTIAAAVTSSNSILNQGLRGVGWPSIGIASQLLGTGLLALLAMILLPRFGLMGMAWAVVLSAGLQGIVLVVAAARMLRVSPYCFWPFSAKDVRVFCQSVMALRLKYSRSPA